MFLSLQVAWSIASGNGVTDSLGHPTSGFQPLWVLILAVLAAVLHLGKVALYRTALLLGTLFSAATGVVAGRIAQDFVDPPLRPVVGALAPALWMTDLAVTVLTLNGLETALALFSLSVVMLATVRLLILRPPSLRSCAIVGGLTSVAAWARNDALLLVPALGLLLIVRSQRLARGDWGRSARLVGIMAATCLSLTAPWIAWNYHVLGTLQPQSGQAYSIFTYFTDLSSRAQACLFIWSRLFAPSVSWLGAIFFSPLFALRLLRPDSSSPLGMVLQIGQGVLCIALFVWVRRRQSRRTEPAQAGRSLSVLALWPFFGFALAIGCVYGFYRSSLWFASRYHAPMVLVGVVSTCALLQPLCDSFGWTRRGVARWIGSLLLLSIAGNVAGALHRPTRAGATDAPDHFRQLSWVRQRIPRGARLCSYQTGVLGYLGADDFTVINIDGKLNPEALRARIADARDSGPDALLKRHEVAYLKQNCDFVFDWSMLIDAPIRSSFQLIGSFRDPAEDVYLSILLRNRSGP
jgi:hypothetical protein